jgi:hypothetical protein
MRKWQGDEVMITVAIIHRGRHSSQTDNSSAQRAHSALPTRENGVKELRKGPAALVGGRPGSTGTIPLP